MRLWQQAKRGELNFSTGSASHTVDRVPISRRANWLRSWPIVEVSLVPRDQAAEPRAIVEVKSLIGIDDGLFYGPEPEEIRFELLRFSDLETRLRYLQAR